MSKKIIRAENLDEIWVKDNILKTLEENKPKYLSTESKDSLAAYVSNEKAPKATKELWLNLLIDAVTLLKINDSREKIYGDFQKSKDARDNFDAHFSKVRKTNSFGMEELSGYLDDFISFESMLYGADNHYRDHMNHVFQVWAIGWELLKENSFEMNDNYQEAKKFVFHFEIPKKKKHKHLMISQSEIWAMWTIIALCHDLGYPIEKSFKINQKTKQIINRFGSVQFTELDYNFSILSSFLVEKFLNIISSKVVHPSSIRGKEYATSIQTKFRDKFSKSLEDYKHGIFSGLLLFKDLTYFLESDYYIDKPISKEDARQFHIRREILRSISTHTCPKLYHINLNTLSFLLILCDELQEWNRPNFDSLARSKPSEDPTVSMSEFDISDAKKPQTIKIKMSYKNMKDEEIEEGVKRRFRNINYLFRGASDDGRRKIHFEWEILSGTSLQYLYCFDSEKDSFEQLDVQKNVKEFDIYRTT
jgi:hypothetical protein